MVKQLLDGQFILLHFLKQLSQNYDEEKKRALKKKNSSAFISNHRIILGRK